MPRLEQAVSAVKQTPKGKLYGQTEFLGHSILYALSGPGPPFTAEQALAALFGDGGAAIVPDLGLMKSESSAFAVLSHSRDPKVRRALIPGRYGDSIADTKTVDFLACVDPGLRAIIAANALPSQATLMELCQQYAYAVSSNRHAPEPVLLKLAHHGLVAVRKNVASNQNATAAVLLELAYDRSPEVLKAVARNPATPDTALHALANIQGKAQPGRLRSNAAQIKGAVAVHPNATASILRSLAEDGFDEEVASHGNATSEILRTIARKVLDVNLDESDYFYFDALSSWRAVIDSLLHNSRTPDDLRKPLDDHWRRL